MTQRDLTIELRSGETVAIDGGRIVLTLQKKTGQIARILFTADENVTIKKGRSAQAGAEQAKLGLASV
jgi:hypothetical protein